MPGMPELALAIAVVASNLFWFIHARGMQKNALETAKLLASRTLSEYAWLQKQEKAPEQKKKEKEPDYDSLFDEEPE